MQLIYYHWESQKIVYSFIKDEFDIEFVIPGLRAAYYITEPKNMFNENITSYGWNWSVNCAVQDLNQISSELFSILLLKTYQCKCIRDVIRLGNVMKTRMRHDNVDLFIEDEFISQNKKNVEAQFIKFTRPIINKIVDASTISEIQIIYRDFWVSTKYIDDLADYNINKLI